MRTPKQRAAALNVRGNIALVAAVAFGGLLASNLGGAGGWTTLHTWLTVAVTTTAAAALACFALAARFRSPRGDSPQVTHPPTEASLTPSEVQK
ncbi:hypothetical protein [Micromonospora tarensis]|uniref:Uncharacterized protein n=1 Tax=Micromonospora tarensis TaxID=2806100 RepID=A0ABS1YQE2_9ACTN|nr:hypothetical protein [Micromonospora tarensis]MBM0279654.1 hypothetical protein [Micromonospora tarensis]